MIKKEDVQKFLRKYVCNYIKDDHIKSVETITRPVSYDMELVFTDKEDINRYFVTNFGLDSRKLTLDKLMKTSEGEVWNNLETVKDLKLLEELLGLGLVSGLFKEDFMMRIEVFNRLGKDNVYMCPELMTYCPENESSYMEYFKEHVLPVLYFDLCRENIKIEGKCAFNQDDKKELLLFWFTMINETNVDETTKSIFEMALEKNVEAVLNTAVILRILRQGPEDLYNKIQVQPSLRFIDQLDEEAKKLSLEKLEYLDEVKVIFLSELDRIKNYYRFDNKKTL